jgi:hypothetical protein
MALQDKTEAELMGALRAADAAGDTTSAQRFADVIKEKRSVESSPSTTVYQDIGLTQPETPEEAVERNKRNEAMNATLASQPAYGQYTNEQARQPEYSYTTTPSQGYNENQPLINPFTDVAVPAVKGLVDIPADIMNFASLVPGINLDDTAEGYRDATSYVLPVDKGNPIAEGSYFGGGFITPGAPIGNALTSTGKAIKVGTVMGKAHAGIQPKFKKYPTNIADIAETVKRLEAPGMATNAYQIDEVLTKNYGITYNDFNELKKQVDKGVELNANDGVHLGISDVTPTIPQAKKFDDIKFPTPFTERISNKLPDQFSDMLGLTRQGDDVDALAQALPRFDKNKFSDDIKIDGDAVKLFNKARDNAESGNYVVSARASDDLEALFSQRKKEVDANSDAVVKAEQKRIEEALKGDGGGKSQEEYFEEYKEFLATNTKETAAKLEEIEAFKQVLLEDNNTLKAIRKQMDASAKAGKRAPSDISRSISSLLPYIGGFAAGGFPGLLAGVGADVGRSAVNKTVRKMRANGLEKVAKQLSGEVSSVDELKAFMPDMDSQQAEVLYRAILELSAEEEE